MATYTVQANGVEMGKYTGADEDAALAAYLKDAGYKTAEQAAEVCGQTVESFLADIKIAEQAADYSDVLSTWSDAAEGSDAEKEAVADLTRMAQEDGAEMAEDFDRDMERSDLESLAARRADHETVRNALANGGCGEWSASLRGMAQAAGIDTGCEAWTDLRKDLEHECMAAYLERTAELAAKHLAD
jgi:hypothetical protein